MNYISGLKAEEEELNHLESEQRTETACLINKYKDTKMVDRSIENKDGKACYICKRTNLFARNCYYRNRTNEIEQSYPEQTRRNEQQYI